ncbi:LAFE_0E09472g1_1 [Lachancea fermentati]|uniref:Inheritance of peroxisomes protein 2 n=1 Tax=Lachancea fermentati TaxID=4955 RepID=A0A1G4MDJ3_LACFM|nr:LAFE_0E09472g1_1 [Lachancea fermentati]
MSFSDSDKLPKVKLPGLQIFSNGYFSRSNSTLTHEKYNIAHDSWSSSSPRIPLEASNQLRKLSDWGIEHLNDSSPTVIESGDFGTEEVQAYLQEKGDDHDSKQSRNVSSLEKLVPQMFAESPLSSYKFIEEFQYTIIASQLLTDSFRSSYKPPSSQQSILDFRKEVGPCNGFRTPMPTKYGLLSVRDKGFELQRTVPFMPTMLRCHRCLNALTKGKQQTRCKTRVFSVLAIGVYLALQQEYFHSQYIQYSTLIALKSSIKYLRDLDALLHRFHMHYKELTIYKPIGLVQSNQMTDSNLPVVRDILSSSLDLLFYELKHALTNILPVISLRELRNCCTIYNLSTVDVYYAITSDALEVAEKSRRVNLLKKFTLCCLLSVNDQIPEESNETQEMQRALQKTFPIYENMSWMPNYKKFTGIQTNLCKLNTCLKVVLLNLRRHRGEICLSDADSAKKSDSHNSQNSSYQTVVTLNKLREMENFLLSSCDTEENIRSSVFEELRSLLKFWQPRIEAKPKQCIKPHRDRHFSGLNFDIVKSPNLNNKEFTYSKEPSTFTGTLDSPVDFNVVEDLDMDLEKENGEDASEEVFSSNENHNDKESFFNRESFKKMTDEELRQKLNERIMHLAIENKRGKAKLRTKKSFELLSTNANFQRGNSQLGGKSRTFHETACISEESIPVLYELKHLLENK